MNKKYLYGLSALMLVSGMATMTSCQSEEDLIGGGQKVMLTISADKQDEATRTQFTPSGKGLNSVWTAGDQLLITTHSGIAGVVTLSSGAGTASGVFKGEVTLSDNGEDEIALFYLGKGVNPADVKDKKYIIDLSSQTDNLEGLAEKDFLATTCFVKYMNGTANASVEMNRYVDEAYFTLELPDGLTLGEGDVVTISGDNMTVGRAITLSETSGDVWGWDNTAANQVTGSITVTKTSEMGNALYFTMHGNQTVAPTFTVTKDGYRYTATMSTAHTWNGSEFVNNNGEPIAVTNWTKEEIPTDPGDFNNWGGNVTYPSYGTANLTRIGNSADAWCSNERSFQDFGFAAPYTFPYNAIENGILTSNTYNNGEQARFFQWGRWLGFPRYVENRYVTMLSYGGSGTGAYPRGISDSMYQAYYCWDMDSRATYAYTTAWTSSGMKKQQAVNSSIIFICRNADYLQTADMNLSWQERCGNPCPDGYRIPTADEMYIFVPEQGADSDGNYSGSHAEIKVVNGQKYAVKWTVNSANKSVSVISVPTTENTVTANSAIFNGKTPVVLEAKGFLYSENEGVGLNETLTDGTYVGGYWTSSSTLEGENIPVGNSLCVMVYVKGNTWSVALEYAPRTWGLCVMPIKDSKAKATPQRPWVPLGY